MVKVASSLLLLVLGADDEEQRGAASEAAAAPGSKKAGTGSNGRRARRDGRSAAVFLFCFVRCFVVVFNEACEFWRAFRSRGKEKKGAKRKWREEATPVPTKAKSALSLPSMGGRTDTLFDLSLSLWLHARVLLSLSAREELSLLTERSPRGRGRERAPSLSEERRRMQGSEEERRLGEENLSEALCSRPRLFFFLWLFSSLSFYSLFSPLEK